MYGLTLMARAGNEHMEVEKVRLLRYDVYYTMKPVCNDHLYNGIYYRWFIQQCVLVKTEATNLQFLPSGAHQGDPWPPRWAPEGREVSH